MFSRNGFFSAASAVLLTIASGSLYAVDTDGDGSPDEEEIIAGTDINDPNYRPFWWKTIDFDFSSSYSSYSSAGDIDNDGIEDFIIGGYDPSGVTSAVKVFSGRDGSLIQEFVAPVGFQIGASVTSLGDVNGDGIGDIATSTSYRSRVSPYQDVLVYSGIDGALIYTITGSRLEWDNFGFELGRLQDVNQDGVDEILVSAIYAGDLNHGAVSVYSGADGSRLFEVVGSEPNGNFGSSVAGLPDLDGDGVSDFVVGATSEKGNLGTLRAFSGKDGSLIFQVTGNLASGTLGSSVSPAGDMNGDGVVDIVAGIPNASGGIGLVRVYSGVDGSVLIDFSESRSGLFGLFVKGVGDINGDGFMDIAASRGYDSGDWYYGYGISSLAIYSGKDKSVLVDLNGETYEDYGINAIGPNLLVMDDIDGDGLMDYVTANGNRAGARIYLGKDLLNDLDRDFLVNAPDLDDDNDGVDDVYDLFPNDGTKAGDYDNDGIDSLNYSGSKPYDNCPGAANFYQIDTDKDGIGNACDEDLDGDGYDSAIDAFPYDQNNWLDSDNDGVGDKTDSHPNDPALGNDTDNDGIPDLLDEDDDNDGLTDVKEKLLGTNPKLADTDGDAFEDGNDSFPFTVYYPFKTDYAFHLYERGVLLDGTIDCELLISPSVLSRPYPDQEQSILAFYEGITYGMPWSYSWNGCYTPDSPPHVIDSYGFKLGPYDISDSPVEIVTRYACDSAGGNVTCYPSEKLSIPVLPRPQQNPDIDGDGVTEIDDAFPLDPSEWLDSDNDGVGDNADGDDDNDGVPDISDDFPFDPSESKDTDGDGVGDNTDVFPDDASETLDADGDGIGDNADPFPNDFDNDAVDDSLDVFPNDPTESQDTDGDGVGDNADVFPDDASETMDSDGDGVGDNSDVFPNDSSESLDSDNDGTGDNADVYPFNAEASELKTYDGGGSLPLALLGLLFGMMFHRIRGMMQF